MRRLAGCCLALAAVLACAACEDATRPDPDPQVVLMLAADGGYRLDGRPIAPDRLDAELTRRAADATDDKLGRSRLRVRINFAPGIAYQRVLDLQERCQGLGIVQVEVQR